MDNLRSLLKELQAASRSEPDYRKGWTMNEWADAWERSRQASAELVRVGLRTGKWVLDKDYRVCGDYNRKVPVYRPKAGWKAKPPVRSKP